MRRWTLATALAAGAVMVALPLATSGASDAAAGFVARASAHAGRLTFTVPAFAVVETIADGGGPVAEATLESTGGTSLASLPYPGENGIAFPGLFAAATGQSLPFEYPFYASASHPTNPESEVRDPSGAYDLHATAGPAGASGQARFQGSGGEGANSGQGGSTSRATAVAEGTKITVTAETVSEALSLGDDALRIASVRSRSVTVYQPGKEPVTTTDLIVEGGQAGGYTFGYDRNGFVVASQAVPIPTGAGLEQVNAALEPSGLSVRVVEADPVEGGAAADSFEILSRQGPPAPGVPGAVVRLSFGGATTSVRAGSGAPLADVAPPVEEVNPEPDAPESPAPVAPQVTGVIEPVPTPVPASEPAEVAPGPAGFPVAPASPEPPSGEVVTGEAVPAPAVASAPALAAPIYEPVLRSRGIDSLTLVYGSAMALGLVALVLATLWRAKGVTH